MNSNLLKLIMLISKHAFQIFLVQLIALNFLIAGTIKGQSLDEVYIDIDLRDETLTNIFDKIESQTDFIFGYNDLVLDNDKKLTITFSNASLMAVLSDISKKADVNFRRINNTISISKRNEPNEGISPPVTDQLIQMQVTGKVLDENGEALPGATVLEKGTTNGTITDIEGNFSLEVSDNASLSISFVGFRQIEIAVNGRSAIDIVMQIDAASLEEVVVIGYGSVSRKDLTGSVGSVSADEIVKAPVRSFDEALAGRIAGVQISTDDGQPGALPNIVIRGSNSLTQDNSPLFVIDGFPVEDNINSAINPEDIESIDVLKDASATAIYGARGSNGVIIITTKRGKIGKPIVSYNTYYGFNKDVKRTELLSPYEFVKAQMEIDLKSAAQLYLDSIGKTLEDYRYEEGTDWYELCLQNAASKSHNLSVRGGGEGTKYSVSLSYFDQEGLFINTGFNRYQGRIALDQQLSKRIKAGLDINLSQQKTYGTYANEGDQGSSTLMGAIWLARPVLDNLGLMNEDDIYDLVYDPSLPSQAIGYRINPYLQLQNELKLARDNIILANLYVEYEILKDFKLRITGGINQTNSRNSEFYNSKTKTGSPGHSGSLGVNGKETSRIRSSYVNENTLSYNKSFSNDHHLNMLVGYTQQVGEFETFGTQVVQISDENLGLSGLDLGTPRSVSASSSSWALMSFLGRINYNYKQKYFFTTTFRSDGSSKFSKGNRWGYFPSAAVAYRISNEEFWNNVPIISDMKIRASYGATGNNRVSDFAYLSEINSSNSSGYSFGNETPSRGTYSQIGNGDLKWETTKQTNIGLDFSVLQNRVTFIVDYYNKLTDGILLNAQLPEATGYSSGFRNIGSMSNSGLEFTASYGFTNSKGFSWNTSFNIAFNRNKIVSLGENEDAILATARAHFNRDPNYISKIGYPAGMFYGVIYDGTYKYDDFYIQTDGTYRLKEDIPANGRGQNAIVPGDTKWRDINGDNNIDANDFTIIGNPNPDFIGGVNNNITYKGFDLSIFFQFSYGNEVFNASNAIFGGRSSGARHNQSNFFASVEDRWSPENPESDIPILSLVGPRPYYDTRWIEDGSFIRLKTVSLGYNVPNKLIKLANIESLRIYSTAQNLFTLTNYTGNNPEASTRRSTLTPSFDFAAYPLFRTVVFGLNVTF